MTDLSEFLLARIAEDEAAANQARWAMQGEWFTTAEDKVDEFVRHNSPTRVLADCAAKRRIVENAVTNGDSDEYDEYDYVLGLLALPYADHPDYDQEWRP